MNSRIRFCSDSSEASEDTERVGEPARLENVDEIGDGTELVILEALEDLLWTGM